jgi:hypothetical protein
VLPFIPLADTSRRISISFCKVTYAGPVSMRPWRQPDSGDKETAMFTLSRAFTSNFPVDRWQSGAITKSDRL